MNEVTRIHLGRQQFVVAVDAHKALQTYLHGIEHEVGKDKEVVKEVELRMAELLTERGVSGDKVVLADDITFLREQLGEPSAFSSDDDTPEADDTADNPPRRLFRDADAAAVAGVCAGLARYSGINVWAIRLLFIVLTLAGASGILIYLLLWIFVPAAKTKSDFLQMQGKAVTVDTIKELVDRADVEGAARRAGSVLERILRVVFRIVRIVFGVALMTTAIAGLIGLGAMGTYIAAHHATLVDGVFAFPVGPLETLFLVAASVFAALLMIFLLTIGLSVIRRKWVLSGWLSAVLGGLMLVSVTVGGALGPDTIQRIQERYKAEQTHVVRDMQPFSGLHLIGRPIEYQLLASDTYRIEVSYLGAVRSDDVKITQDGDRVTIDTSALHARDCHGFCLGQDDFVHVTVYAPEKQSVTADDGAIYEVPEGTGIRLKDQY